MKFLLLFLLFSTTLVANEITVGIQERIYERYNKLLENRDPLLIDDFTGLDRDIVEVVIIQQALSRTRFKVYRFIPVPTVKRLKKEVETGRIDLSANTDWGSDLNKMDLLESIKIVDYGEFEVGVYVLEGREELQNITSLEEIRTLKFVSSRQWVVDWNTLESLGIDVIVDNPKWSGMIKMIQNRRVDALLAPFQSREDLKIIYDEGNLLPIKGIKIGLNDYRSFYLSKNTSFSRELSKELGRVLEDFIESGYIRRAYTEAGFYNIDVNNWSLIK